MADDKQPAVDPGASEGATKGEQLSFLCLRLYVLYTACFLAIYL